MDAFAGMGNHRSFLRLRRIAPDDEREAMSSPVRRIVIADDHEAIRVGVRTTLSANPDWRIVGEADNGRDALELIRPTQPSSEGRRDGTECVSTVRSRWTPSHQKKK